MYTKDLVSLLKLLSVSGQTGVLHIEPPGRDQDEKLWYAQILLVEGQVRAGRIQRRDNGQLLLRDTEALNWLSGQGGLSWMFEEKTKQELIPPPPAPSIRAIANKMVIRPGLGPLREANPGRRDEKARETQLNVEKSTSTVIPRHTVNGRHAEVNLSWPRDHRLVFALIDGRRTLKEIAVLLKKTPEHVEHVLDDFRKINLIEY